MDKYVRVMDGLTSNAGGFEYKLDEINVAVKWNPNSLELKEMGEFNFGTVVGFAVIALIIVFVMSILI